MSFTKAELEAMRAADAEIEADFRLTPEEIAAARDRDKRAVLEQVCVSEMKSAQDVQAALQRKRAKKKAYAATPEAKEKAKKWREANKEYLREYQKEYYQRNKDWILQRQLAYDNANRERRNEAGRRYYALHREERLSRQKARRAKKKAMEAVGQ